MIGKRYRGRVRLDKILLMYHELGDKLNPYKI